MSRVPYSHLDDPNSQGHAQDQPFDPLNLPPGAGQPRFLGAGPELRESYAQSTTSFGTVEYESARGTNYGSTNSTANLASAAAAGGTGAVGSPLLHSDHTPYRDDPNAGIPMSPMASQTGFRDYSEKREKYTDPRAKSKRKVILAVIIVGTIIGAIIAIAVPVWYFVIRPNSNSAESSTDGGSGKATPTGTGTGPSTGPTTGGKPTNPKTAITGGDGTKIMMENGTEFTYKNEFGGYWFFDPENPFKSAARAQAHTPALNETWDYNVHKIMGVNLGGWLNTEPFISPALYEKYYPNAVDEFTLSQQMRADPAGIAQLVEHYKTFITEEDFAAIAGAGLNWIRLPFGFWAIEVWEGEPFLERESWKYLLKGIEWARKYGLRINLDLHAVPGSQNGWNHSGRLGVPNFMNGVMGIANAQRTLDYLRIIVQFISQPQYKEVIPMFGLINEVLTSNIGDAQMRSFYVEAYKVIREVTGYGQGKGPVLALHDGFVGVGPWAGLYPGADRLALDIHPYFAFGEQTTQTLAQQALRACTTWGGGTNTSMGAFGITSAGEFSNAINDCGLYVNGVAQGTRYEKTFAGYAGARIGDCERWTDWTKYSAEDKAGLMEFALASMDALTHWFFWTWKIGNTLAKGRVEAPFWSYRLGLENGWMPKDPRQSMGKCAQLGVAAVPAPPLPASATGGTGGGPIQAVFTNANPWPPASLSAIPNAAVLPVYTQTGAIKTMPGPTFTKPGTQETFDAGNGWFNPADKAGAYTVIPGCTYPDRYNAVTGVPIPAARCGAARKRGPIATAAPTPAPKY